MKYLFNTAIILLLFTGCGEKDYIVLIHTKYGVMKAILYDNTPKHKANFLKLVKEKKYDSTIFHRVIKDFMVQGGDIESKTYKPEKIGSLIPAEITEEYFHHKGALAAARMGDDVNPKKESSGCQFYIVQGKVFPSEDHIRMDNNKLNNALLKLLQMPEYALQKYNLTNAYQLGYTTKDFSEYEKQMQELIPIVKEKITSDIYITKPFTEAQITAYTTVGGTPHLDREYTVFGKIVEGLSIIDSIALVQTSRGDRPIQDIFIKMTLQEIPKKDFLYLLKK
ncbi:MAG: peptidylprolyl isomerase [Chitinophagaceae bacterium]|nr:peptidylprolyl isomerase [Chitinophagaceae bacterium]